MSAAAALLELRRSSRQVVAESPLVEFLRSKRRSSVLVLVGACHSNVTGRVLGLRAPQHAREIPVGCACSTIVCSGVAFPYVFTEMNNQSQRRRCAAVSKLPSKLKSNFKSKALANTQVGFNPNLGVGNHPT